MDKPILIYGASGFTGQCCVDAAEAFGIPYLVGGRNRAKLESVSGPGCVGVRVADVANVGAAFEGVSCVVSTVGPFATHGLPVLDAAIKAGAHYVDTTAEQSFMATALTRDGAAKTAGITALPACGVEYAPMFLAAALLPDGPTQSFLWLDDFLPTRGSFRSMIAMAGVGPTPYPFRVSADGRHGWAIRIPGAEEVMLNEASRTYLVLKLWEALPFALTWLPARLLPLEKLGDAIALRMNDPTLEQRSRAGFTVVVRQGSVGIRLDGTDVYASTGAYSVKIAEMLADGEGIRTGVLPAGRAFEPESTLKRLGLLPRWIQA